MDQFLTCDLLSHATLASMERLATWLGVTPVGPWDSLTDEWYALRAAIMRAEQRLAEGPRDLRWVQRLPTTKATPVAPWPVHRLLDSTS